MIGTLVKFSGLARAGRLVAYMITAKSGAEGPRERVGMTSSHLVPAGITPSPTDQDNCRAFAGDVALLMRNWTRDARPNKEAPKSEFIHLTLSFHPDDAVSPESAGTITEEVINQIVGDDRPRFLAVHVDREHLHAHALIATVDSAGRIFNPRFDFRIVEAACESAELRHGLIRVKQRKALAKHDPSRAVLMTAASTRELRRSLRSGEPAPRELLKQQLSSALQDSPSISQFSARLSAFGVEVRPHVASTGTVSGLSFVDPAGIAHKGSALGRAFTFGAICRTTNYEHHRDRQIIYEWCTRAKGGRTPPSDRGTEKRTGGHDGRHRANSEPLDREIGSPLRAAEDPRCPARRACRADWGTGGGVSFFGRGLEGADSPAARSGSGTAAANPGIGEEAAAIKEGFSQWSALKKTVSADSSTLLSLLAQLVSMVCAPPARGRRYGFRRSSPQKLLESLDL